MRPDGYRPMAEINVPSPAISESVLDVRLSELDDFRSGLGELHVGRTTLKLVNEIDFDESKIISGGRFSAKCLMSIEGIDQQFGASLAAPLPGRVHSWIKENILDPASQEPVTTVFLESWPAGPRPNTA